jgi:hypothetical protein
MEFPWTKAVDSLGLDFELIDNILDMIKQILLAFDVSMT